MSENCRSSSPSYETAFLGVHEYFLPPQGWTLVKHEVASDYGSFASHCADGALETPHCDVISMIPRGQNAPYHFYDGKVLIETTACASCLDDVCLNAGPSQQASSGGTGPTNPGFRVVPEEPASGGSAGAGGTSGAGGTLATGGASGTAGDNTAGAYAGFAGG